MERKTDEFFRREVKSFIKEFFEELMLDERRQHLDTRPHDKGNGFYDRDLTTSLAHVEGLKVPRTRSGEFSPAILPERRRASFDLEELVFAMHVNGSSTRDISKFIERVYSASLGRDAISRLTDVAQGVIDKWKNRPLAAHYAVVFLDATYVKLRCGTVRSEPVYVAMGVLPNGDRQILGYAMFGSEGESAGAWHEYLLKLKERGVTTVDLFVTDNLRVMPSDRTRMATILITPLMSCSARLPVYILFIGSFIEPRYGALWAAATLFGMHLVGIVVAMPLAWLLNHKVLKSGRSPFILELPEYRFPHWPNVRRRVYDAAMDFLRGVAGIIFALSITIWALAYFPHSEKTSETAYTQFAQTQKLDIKSVRTLAAELKVAEQKQKLKAELESSLRAAHLRDSFLGRFGRWVQPIFQPLGFDWKISVAILAAFPAREVFISTLGIIYSVVDTDAEPEALSKKLSNEKKPDGTPLYSVLLAVTVMVFFALCAQCMSTLAAIRRELRSTRWAVTVFVVFTAIAYLMAMAVWQIGSLFV